MIPALYSILPLLSLAFWFGSATALSQTGSVVPFPPFFAPISWPVPWTTPRTSVNTRSLSSTFPPSGSSYGYLSPAWIRPHQSYPAAPCLADLAWRPLRCWSQIPWSPDISARQPASPANKIGQVCWEKWSPPCTLSTGRCLSGASISGRATGRANCIS